MLSLIVLELGEAFMIGVPLIAHLIYVHVQLHTMSSDIVQLKKQLRIDRDERNAVH